MSVKTDLIEMLNREGWRNYPSRFGPKAMWCKRWKDAPVCQCNDTKEGIQVCLEIYEREGYESYEIEVTGQKLDGIWVKLSAYGIGEDKIMASLNRQADELVRAWTLLNTPLTPPSPSA